MKSVKTRFGKKKQELQMKMNKKKNGERTEFVVCERTAGVGSAAGRSHLAVNISQGHGMHRVMYVCMHS